MEGIKEIIKNSEKVCTNSVEEQTANKIAALTDCVNYLGGYVNMLNERLLILEGDFES